jgi:hypothetical protein
MTFLCHTPSPPLNLYINSFYCPNESAPWPREKILPLPLLDLKINFGGRFEVYGADRSEPMMTLTESWARHGDWQDIAACRAPSPLLVQYDLQDHLFTETGMRDAHARLQAH